MITGKESEYKSIADLKGTPLGISRPGSGSQTMASVMALQQGWDTSALEFKGESIFTMSVVRLRDGSVFSMLSDACRNRRHHHHGPVNNDIHGLIASVNDGSTSAFMWEWFTTKPFADAGAVRFVSHRTHAPAPGTLTRRRSSPPPPPPPSFAPAPATAAP